MKIFDSHCHPQFEKYDPDREAMIKRAVDAGVGMICVGTDFETSKQGIELAKTHETIWATAGLHPSGAGVEAGSMNQEAWEELLQHPKVVAVGEVGLDYYRTPEGTPVDELRARQKEVFEQFLNLAIEYKKPIILHARDAGKGSAGIVHADMISILTNHYSLTTIHHPGVAHSFTGTVDEARQYLDLGFYLGFNGIITFTKQYDDLVKFVPMDRILLETDAPFLAPVPHRGQRNEPAYIVEVAKRLAELKNEPYETIIEQTTENCKKLFKI